MPLFEEGKLSIPLHCNEKEADSIDFPATTPLFPSGGNRAFF